MSSKSWLAGAAIFILIAGPSAAQNAHHYQGGPKTVVPHSMTHPASEAPVTKKIAKRKAGKRNSTADAEGSGRSRRPITGHTGHHPGH